MQTKLTFRPRSGVLSRTLLRFTGALALATAALSSVPAAAAEANSSLYNPDAEYLVWKIEQAPAEAYAQLEQGGPAPTPEDKAELLKFYDNQYRQWHVKYSEYFNANFPKVNNEGFKQALGVLREIFLDLSRTKDWKNSNSNEQFLADDMVKAIAPGIAPIAARKYDYFVQYTLVNHLESAEPDWRLINRTSPSYSNAARAKLSKIDKNFRPELTNELTKYGTFAKSLLDDYQKYVGNLPVEKKNQVIWFLTNVELYAKMTRGFDDPPVQFYNYVYANDVNATNDHIKLSDYSKVVLADKPVAEYNLPQAEEGVGNRRLGRAEGMLGFKKISLLQLISDREKRELLYAGTLLFSALPNYPANCQLADTACMEEALVAEAKKAKRLYNFWYAGQTYGNIFEELYWPDRDNPTNPAARIKYYVDLYNGKATK